jgi:orotidine-5'-phosphate decarboxylase
MGLDSLEPFTRRPGKGVIVLCRTSNPGGDDLQSLALEGGERLYERIARLAATEWNASGELGLVVGATYPRELERVRALAPTLPLLIPGVGAQGGDAVATVRAAWRGRLDAPGQPGQTTGPIIVNSSRAILYAGQGPDFGRAARQAAEHTRTALNGARAG